MDKGWIVKGYFGNGYHEICSIYKKEVQAKKNKVILDNCGEYQHVEVIEHVVKDS